MAAAAAQIPVIDIAAEDQAQVARELVDAAVEHGFVYIKNQGRDIPLEAIENAFAMSKTLFASPTEEKQQCTIQKNNRGWSGMHVETLDPAHQRVGDFKEAFNFGEFVNGVPQQPLPPAISSQVADIDTFFHQCHDLALKLNALLGVGLATDPPDFFRAAHLPSRGPSGTTLRWLRYPPLAATPDAQTDDVRAGAHSDYGSLTLLFRLKGQAGLEILTRENNWAPVPVSPPGTESDPAPPILVNIGDLLSYWTGGLLRSTVHRVVFPKSEDARAAAAARGEDDAQPRYSMAFFCHPAGSVALEPVPSERVREFAAKGKEAREGNPYDQRKVLTAEEHLHMRLKASYLTLYEGDDDKAK
ncbi:oxidoreductase [Gaeumannomyces tritici R3-111a-1]|uniref:Oxidoreductase n=1 Tax=Gaeumannomyces tritici (strain R3-111a-1) TaxID=644352 RepID=J3P1C0_GAET3|nr:oxidoreductase [Gaeumannomyces tritici R3-111a-1]EJT77405.1 oxidoreductase [Gaeumannomyces tritici R3-111a-1]